MQKDEIDTPALVVDLEILSRNIEELARFAREKGRKLRPHAKTHKVPEIAQMQIQAGAVGICVQKLGEAEVMARGGLRDIFVSNEVVGKQKMPRLTRLAEKVKLSVAVDHPQNITEIGEACREAGVEVGVYVDVDPGMHRTGVPPERAPDLARLVSKTDGLFLVGVMGYEGHAGGPRDRDERMRLIREAMETTMKAVRLIKQAGVEPGEVSVGSSATVRFSAGFEGVTELQPGMYVFNDYYLVEREAATPATCALHVLATIMSRAAPDRGVVDAGSKAFHLDMGRYPVAVGVAGVEVFKFSEEHGWLKLSGEAQEKLKLGDRIEFIPYHVCPCVNQFDTLYGLRNDRVEKEWQIEARGKLT